MKKIKISNGVNKKIKILIIIVLIFVFSQWLLIKMVYSNKITGSTARLLAKTYQLKAGSIKDEDLKINIYLEDFFENYDFAKQLLSTDISTNNNLANLDIDDQEISELVWTKLLKQAWLKKIAAENDIEVTKEDIDYYIETTGGQESLEKNIAEYKVSFDDYKKFLLEAGILETKVYDYLVSNFADEKGVMKIQEAYALLEAENGQNWDEVVKEYGEDTRLSDNSIWLAEEDLVGSYEAITGIEPGEFSKIVQVFSPNGYIIWHLDSIAKDEGVEIKEIRGLFVYAQAIDDFFDAYLNSVTITKKY
jgi:hypothetical protein